MLLVNALQSEDAGFAWFCAIATVSASLTWILGEHWGFFGYGDWSEGVKLGIWFLGAGAFVVFWAIADFLRLSAHPVLSLFFYIAAAFFFFAMKIHEALFAILILGVLAIFTIFGGGQSSRD